MRTYLCGTIPLLLFSFLGCAIGGAIASDPKLKDEAAIGTIGCGIAVGVTCLVMIVYEDGQHSKHWQGGSDDD